ATSDPGVPASLGASPAVSGVSWALAASTDPTLPLDGSDASRSHADPSTHGPSASSKLPTFVQPAAPRDLARGSRGRGLTPNRYRVLRARANLNGGLPDESCTSLAQTLEGAGAFPPRTAPQPAGLAC